ncbi:hypothetical protein OSB04_015983 [Centaurea solstitialis]|uniref:F-box domain-containing protein n=1 Tax=Centaurea solstitialis TaxID=347529 RepID=A0AA38T066_9ASTR|nr:hypothetical protein OSB04_015983 [Centaurea solstitialis]
MDWYGVGKADVALRWQQVLKGIRGTVKDDLKINPSMENLPSDDVVVDILSRLPVKTIIHCKCVCKKWHNLVSNSYFINLHLSRSPAGFMVHRDPPDDATSGILNWVEIEDRLDHHSLHHEPVLNFDLNGYLPAPNPDTILIPVGSVNGLICLSQHGVQVDNIHICNPITREYLALPRQPNYRKGLEFIIYNFGVNSLTGEYKVLRIFQVNSPQDPYSYIPRGSRASMLLEAEVYTLGTSQWRCLGQVPYRVSGYATFLNGYFHWKVPNQDAPESIFTFDLDKEMFQLFPSPPTEPGAMLGCSENLGVLKGCLCKSYAYDSQITIWVMKQYAVMESWHKELVITQAICDVRDWLMMKSNMYVFGGLQDGTIMVVLGHKVLAYCPKSNTLEDLAILDNWGIVKTHRPSFIKLKDIDSERFSNLDSICRRIMPPISPSMENLPEEVMVDILSRLPVKKIIHCKCVCKKWHNLVNDSYFIDLHLSRSPAGFMAHDYANRLDGSISGILKWVEIEDGLEHHSLHHEHVLNFDLNGYLPAPIPDTYLFSVGSVNGLICILQRGVKVGVKVDNVYICNPITREYLTLPRSQNPKDGFIGYNIHWEVYHEDSPGSIFTFDLDKETFQLFPSPSIEPGAMQKSTRNLGVLRGCLCRLDIYDFHLKIWVMKQYGIKESWHKELVITQPICAKSRLDGTILVVVGGKMLAYCPKSNIFEDFSLLNNCFVRMTHHHSFIKLKDIDLERVHTFKC